MPASSPLYGVSRLPLLDVVTSVGMLGFDVRARREALRLLDPQPSERILDVACGTGRNLPLLAAAVGSAGAIVGIDRSGPLLKRAERRTAGLANVELVRGDWMAFDSGARWDGAICCLGLSVVDDWRAALDRIFAAIRPGGRVAMVDWLVDERQSRVLNAYVRVGSALACADPGRRIPAAMLPHLRMSTARRMPLGLHLVAGVVDAAPKPTRRAPDQPRA